VTAMKAIWLRLGLCATLAAAACASTVQVPVDAGRTQFREMPKLDCKVYDQRGRALTAEVRFAQLWGAQADGATVQRAELVGARFQKGVQALVVQSKELCGRYNGGAVTQEEYDARLAEIDQLYAEAAGVRQSVDETIRRHSRDSFGDLDKETGAPAPAATADPESVVAAVDALVNKLGVP
jgi:hypothetical protein